MPFFLQIAFQVPAWMFLGHSSNISEALCAAVTIALLIGPLDKASKDLLKLLVIESMLFETSFIKLVDTVGSEALPN
jgi:hypothetical protein